MNSGSPLERSTIFLSGFAPKRLKQGIEMVLHVPETKAYRETMAKDFRNQMGAEAKRHNFYTLQSLLQQQGWDPGLIDGILGSRTAAAAAQFAKANGLSPSLGPENPALWEALSQAAAAHLSLPVH